MRILSVTTEARRLVRPQSRRYPLNTPIVESSGEFVIISVTIDAGDVCGTGLTMGPARMQTTLVNLIEGHLSEFLRGRDPRQPRRLFDEVTQAYSQIGFTGLLARAYAAVDAACWDIAAQAAHLPLPQLLGAARPATPFLFVANRDEAEIESIVGRAREYLAQGAMGVRVTISGPDVQTEADRVRTLTEALGEDVWLGVSSSGRYDLETALAIARFFEDIGVDQWEDPLPATDVEGYKRLAHSPGPPLAVGSTFDRLDDFYHVIRSGGVRTLRPDVCRLGGLTPIISLAAVAEANHVTLCPVLPAEWTVPLACGLKSFGAVDYVDWLEPVVDGGPRMAHARLVPNPNPGLGLRLRPEC